MSSLQRDRKYKKEPNQNLKTENYVIFYKIFTEWAKLNNEANRGMSY